jgi:UMF1 family MFS transporter
LVAGLVGMVMGGLQSTSRATYSKYLPNTKDTASYFSFYGVTEKIAVVFGMTLFGVVDQITGSMRLSVIFFMLFFLLGGFLILSINNKKGKINNKQLA